MAADKKEDGSITLLNKGLRHFDLGADKEGKPRRHAPGTTMSYTAEEAKKHSIYKDLIDISKMPGQVDVRKLKADKEALQDENTRLKAQLEALSTAKTEKPKKADKPEVVEAAK